MSTPTHAAKVSRVIAEVKALAAASKPFRIYHGSTNSTRLQSFKRDEMINVSDFNEVLAVDTKHLTMTVEPNVPMDVLVRTALKYDLVPPVVPEFPGITVGGAIQGTSAETSSHKWGCFNQTATSIEIVLPNGEYLVTSASQHADLFHGMAGSFGTFGVVTSITIKLIPAHHYVELTHYHVGSTHEAIKMMNQFATQPIDFIEWVMTSSTQGVVTAGVFSDKKPLQIRRFRRPFDPFYYTYLKKVIAGQLPGSCSVPLWDYLFRFNRGAFWAAELVFRQAGLPFNRLISTMLDPLLRTRKLYQALQHSAASQEYLCQDIVVPKSNVVAFLEWTHETFQLYPIGGCPMLPDAKARMQCNSLPESLLYSIGMYGLRIVPYSRLVSLNKAIEDATARYKGRKWLYAQNYYTPDQFWRVYDKRWYTALRKKYHATGLPSIEEKVITTRHSTVRKRRGALMAILGRGAPKVEP